MSLAAHRTLWSALAGALALVLAHLWRGYDLQLATVTGIAIGLLVFATFRTVARLRDVTRR